MEIKVEETRKFIENAGYKTFIFEGTSIVHEFIDYRDTSHFRVLVKSRTVPMHMMEMGIPTEWWREDYNESNPGRFLLIQYVDEQSEVMFLVLKHCKVYITNKGKTIDSTFVH